MFQRVSAMRWTAAGWMLLGMVSMALGASESVQGKIVELDGDTLVIRVGEGRPQVDMKLTDQTKVFLGDAQARRADLKRGQIVTAMIKDGAVERVVIQPPRKEGDRSGREGEGKKEGRGDEAKAREKATNGRVIKLEDGVLIIGVGDQQREMRLAVEKDTVVTLNKAAAKLEDLKEGMDVRVVQEQGLTRRIEARTRREAGRRDGEERKEGARDRAPEEKARREGDER